MGEDDQTLLALRELLGKALAEHGDSAAGSVLREAQQRVNDQLLQEELVRCELEFVRAERNLLRFRLGSAERAREQQAEDYGQQYRILRGELEDARSQLRAVRGG